MIYASKLIGKPVMSRDGRNLGDVTDLDVDEVRWQVDRLAVRLHRSVLHDLELSKPLLGTRIVWLPSTLVEAVGDTIVLHAVFDDIELGEADEQGDAGPDNNPASASRA